MFRFFRWAIVPIPAAEKNAREACKAAGLDPDEKVFVQVWDPSPDAEPVIHEGSGVIRGVKRPQWKSFVQA